MLDYTKLIKKLVPEQDGEDRLRLRTAVVDDVNADGTVDILLSGILIESVPRLGSAYVEDGGQVQVLSYRGGLLVLGAVAPGPGGALVKTGTTAAIGPTAATSFSSVIPFGVTFPAAPSVHVNLAGTAGVTAQWTGRGTSITTAGFTLFGTGPSNTFTAVWQWTAIYAP
jgi:hypothetical protein